MKNYKFKINGNQYEVEILDIDGDIAKIEVNGTIYDVEIQPVASKGKTAPVSPRPKAVPASETAPPPAGTGRNLEIKAPLPGVIVQVTVREGDEVKAGQTLFTLETMKMENAIKAEKPGRIVAVKINPGQSVLQDEILIVMSIR